MLYKDNENSTYCCFKRMTSDGLKFTASLDRFSPFSMKAICIKVPIKICSVSTIFIYYIVKQKNPGTNLSLAVHSQKRIFQDL